MCGICGYTGKTNEAVLKRMTDSIFHRGPDEEGYYTDDIVNLGPFIQGCHGILEDHLHLPGDFSVQLRIDFSAELIPFKMYLAAGDRIDSHDCPAEGGLSRA